MLIRFYTSLKENIYTYFAFNAEQQFTATRINIEFASIANNCFCTSVICRQCYPTSIVPSSQRLTTTLSLATALRLACTGLLTRAYRP